MNGGNALIAAQTGAGARIVGGRVVDFGSPVAESRAALQEAIVADIGDLGVIAVRGDDAPALLQGQLTADLRTLPHTRSVLAAWCNPQGRALALPRVLRTDGGFDLILPRELIEPTVRRLRMFILRAKVTVDDLGDSAACIGIAASAAPTLTSLNLPANMEDCVRDGDVTVVRLPDPRPRWLLVGPPASLAAQWRAAADGHRPVGGSTWALLDILAGLPQIFAATRERFIPLALNLDALGGIGFQKGCYTGQEIIARMKYRGQLKQRMQVGRLNAPLASAPPGMRLAVAGADMSAGEVVQASAHPDGGVVVTAVVTTELLGRQAVHLDSGDGPVIDWQPLPYPLEPA